MNKAALHEIEKDLLSKAIITTENRLKSRLAKMQDHKRLFIRVSTQFLGGRFDTKA